MTYDELDRLTTSEVPAALSEGGLFPRAFKYDRNNNLKRLQKVPGTGESAHQPRTVARRPFVSYCVDKLFGELARGKKMEKILRQ